MGNLYLSYVTTKTRVMTYAINFNLFNNSSTAETISGDYQLGRIMLIPTGNTHQDLPAKTESKLIIPNRQ
ncbi:MAG TPA: hypothetical protein DCX41_02785 [Aequorivita sp.]|nr:hypothetical protein [Aequorivita sp.]